MNYFPVFLDATKISALVVGGGNVAARKIELLLKSPAKITIVSDKVNDSVARLIELNNIPYIESDYHVSHLQDKTLVIAATNDNEVNTLIAEDASVRGLLLNVVDSPALCNYITPAIIDRSPMVIALSSEGSAPILLQMLKNQIDTILPAGYGKLAEFCGSHRLEVQKRIKQFADRKSFWQKMLSGQMAEYILQGDTETATTLFDQALLEIELNKEERSEQESSENRALLKSSNLNIISLKDNDPDNITLKAYRIMQNADDVYLIGAIEPQFYDYCRRDANKYTDINTDAINQTLEQNNNVVILVNSKEAEGKSEAQLQKLYPQIKIINSGT